MESSHLLSEGSAALANLPPLPVVGLTKTSEAACGFTAISGIVVCAVLFQSVVLAPVTQSVDYFLFGLTCAEGAVAIGCLLGVLFGDPGVVQRTPENCFPLPEQVREALAKGGPSVEALSKMSNIDGADGRTFCVRCLVWRPATRGVGVDEEGNALCLPTMAGDAKAHHCSTCGRCVALHDHHCSVLGRCIAGSCTSGNLMYFYALLGCIPVAVVTLILSLMLRATSPHYIYGGYGRGSDLVPPTLPTPGRL